jgi:bifunctional DNase/RNase
MRENTYYARITLKQNGSEIEVDSRPSDAIALALRAEAKIFAADDVIEESGIEFESEEEAAQDERIRRVSSLEQVDPAEFREFLDTVTPEDFAAGLEEEED